MIRTFVVSCAAITGLLACTALLAADDGKTAQTAAKGKSGDNRTTLFDRLDSNRDGQITPDEVPEEHRQLFERLLRRADRNGDGKLSRDEFQSGLTDDLSSTTSDRPDGANGSGSSDPARDDVKIRRYAASILKQYDANGDGVLDKSEWSKMTSAEKYDRNQDGKITLDEIIETLRPAEHAFDGHNGMPGERAPLGGGFRGGPANPYGASGGGFGAGGFAGGGPGPFMGIALFRALDINNDGKLDAKEIAAATDVLKKFANSNGEITREDLVKSFAAAGTVSGLPAGGGAQGGVPGGRQNILMGGLLSDDQILKSLDKNGDGKLQKNELPPRLQERFEEFDTNHDGVLDESEVKEILPRLARQLQQRAEKGKGNGPPGRPMPPDQTNPDGN